MVILEIRIKKTFYKPSDITPYKFFAWNSEQCGRLATSMGMSIQPLVLVPYISTRIYPCYLSIKLDALSLGNFLQGIKRTQKN